MFSEIKARIELKDGKFVKRTKLESSNRKASKLLTKIAGLIFFSLNQLSDSLLQHWS